MREYLEQEGKMAIKGKVSLYELLRRQDISLEDIENIMDLHFDGDEDVREQVEINSKYEGYIKKAIAQAEKMKKEHSIKIPKDIDYHQVNNLALEARDKLDKIRPLTISQASRISGVNPADIQMLLIHLKKYET